jgi:hypothetical protein
MLRLAHRILKTTTFPCLDGLVGSSKFFHEYTWNKVRRSLADCFVLTADNIADFAFLHGAKQWDWSSDTPCPLPPFDEMFVEWNTGEKFISQIGWLVECQRREFPPLSLPEERTVTFPSGAKCILETGDFAVNAHAVATSEKGDAFVCGILSMWVLSNRGEIKLRPQNQYYCPDSLRGLFNEGSGTFGIPLLLALSFLHCKNVVRHDTTETDGPSSKWLRRQRVPEIRYHVLDINPMKEVLRTEGGIDRNGIKKALHICRGHFATYTEEKPLFGKYTGTVWVPAHIRGSADQGVVDKDYRVKAPKSQESQP